MTDSSFSIQSEKHSHPACGRGMNFSTLCKMIALLAGIFLGIGSASAGDFVWGPDSLYNGTHPVSSNPWSTEWAENPAGGKSIQITITKGEAYYNYIVIPRSRLSKEINDFTAELTFRVVTPTILPKTFYMFARNSVSPAYDIWQRFVGEPGQTRTIRFPMQLVPIKDGQWTIYMGCQGAGSIIVDRLVIHEGRDLILKQPDTKELGASAPATTIPIATGFKPITIDLPRTSTAAGAVRVVSVKGRLVPDAESPVSDEAAQSNAKVMQQIFNELKATPGPATLIFPKGIYRFAGRAPMVLDGVDDLTIDGQGSEFIFQKLYQAECFGLRNCNRVLVKNLYLDWNWSVRPIASLATVKSISNNGKTVSLEFPDLDAAATKLVTQAPWMSFQPIDPQTLYRSRRVEPAGFNVTKAPTLVAEDNRITATFAEAFPLEIGQSYSIRHLYYNLIGFKTASCSHLTFDGVAIYSLPGMGWLNTGGTHHWQFLNCTIDRRPGSRHPLTTAADGIHTNESNGDLIIQNCRFTGLGDDAINLHDNAWQGGLQKGEKSNELKFLNLPKHRLRIAPGDTLRFYNANYSPTGVELKVSEEPVYEGKPNAYSPTTTATIRFTTPAPENLSNLSIMVNSRFDTRNVRIVGNQFIRTLGRGILYAGDDATIEDNKFQEVYGTPIQIQTDIVDNHWAEGHGCNNVVIRKNLFEDSNFSNRWEGAVVYTGGRLPWGPTDYPLFQNFLIEGNHFRNAPGPAMTFTSSRNFVVRDNVIELVRAAPRATPYAGTISTMLSADMTVRGNTWINRIASEYPVGLTIDPATTKNIQMGANQLVTQP